MSEWLTQSNYLMMSIQVVVTFVLVPILSYRLLLNITKNYALPRFPQAAEDVTKWLRQSSRRYWSLVLITLIVAAGIVLHAIVSKSELLNWDNQSGLMIVYLLSMIPVVIMVLMHRSLFGILKKHAGDKRSASLKVRKWQEYIHKPLAALVIAANVVFVATILYFNQHSFSGYAGSVNYLGLLIINLIFAVIIVVVYRDNKTNGLQHPEQRDALKKRAISINLLILSIALLHISLSIWIQGTDLSIYKILVQSVYFQVILIISAFSLTIPKSIFVKSAHQR